MGAWLFIGSALGSLLLVVAEFTTLYTAHVSNSNLTLSSTGTGSNDSYALIPIALLVVILAFAVLRAGSRPALLAIGIAGVVALLIALLGDLPDANSSGNFRTPNGQFVVARTTPGPGMYLETAGAIVLIGTCGLGFLLIGPPQPPRRGPAQAPAARRDAPSGRRQSGS